MNLKEQILNIIHESTTSNNVYSGLYFGNNEILETVNFSFNFNYPKDENDLYADVKFLLDNIIAKTFEKNYDIKYNEYHRTELGNFIYYKGMRANNPFIVNRYKFIDDDPFGNIDEFLDELEVLDNGQRYQVNWKLPILKLDKSNIEVK